MELVAVSSSYQVGEYTGMALLVVGIVYCILRALWILPRTSQAATVTAPIPTRMHPSPPLASSLAPPGFSPTPPGVTPTPGDFAHQSMAASRPPVRWGYVVTALVLAVAFTFSVARMSHTSTSQWDSPAGAQAKAGFLAGCTQGGGSATQCGCLFSQLIAQPEYSTLSGFASLKVTLREYLETRNPIYLPHNYAVMAATCRNVA